MSPKTIALISRIVVSSVVNFQPCNCSLEGSSNHQCDPQTGQCHCMPGYQGLKCDTCALGHYDNLIRCTPCDCNSIGSLDSTCMPTCECDGFGACFCKVKNKNKTK